MVQKQEECMRCTEGRAREAARQKTRVVESLGFDFGGVLKTKDLWSWRFLRDWVGATLKALVGEKVLKVQAREV